MINIVFPAVAVKSNSSIATDAKSFVKQHTILPKDKLAPGTVVMVLNETRTSKTEPRYEGPFLILTRNKGGAYLLQGKDGSIYKRSANQMKSTMIPFVSEIGSDTMHQVISKIIGKIGEDHYLVKFKGSKKSMAVHKQDFSSDHLIRKYENPKRKANSDEPPLKLKFKIPKHH